MLMLEWRETAREDLLAIVEYIAEDDPHAAQRLKDEIETKVSQLRKRPRLYRRGRVTGTREMIVRSNYAVVYAVDVRVVTVLRVLHVARLPPASAGGL